MSSKHVFVSTPLGDNLLYELFIIEPTEIEHEEEMKVLVIGENSHATTVHDTLSTLGYDVVLCDNTDSIKGLEADMFCVDNIYREVIVPCTKDFTWGKKKDSLNHLPYEDRKKFWNRK